MRSKLLSLFYPCEEAGVPNTNVQDEETLETHKEDPA